MLSFGALSGLVAGWVLLGFFVRPRFSSCECCGFRHAFDGRRCDHCGRGIGVFRRLLAALLWPLHLLRSVRELRALPPLNAGPGRILPPGVSAVKAMRALPPDHDDNAERALLGALILESRRIRELGKHVPFSHPAHARIFDAIRHLHEVGGKVDLVILRDYLQRRGALEEVGGAEYLASLVECVPSPANAHYYAEAVGARAPQGMSVALRDVFTQLERSHDGRPTLQGVATGFPELDEVLGGLRARGLYAIAGRPSMGKTSLALALVEHAALRGGMSILIFSPEVTATQLAMRMICSIARVRSYEVDRGRIRSEEYEHLIMAAGALNETHIAIDERVDLDVDALRAVALRQKRAGLDLIVIDALQLVQERSPGRDVGRELKALAVELDVPIVATAPVHRRAESRAGFRPKPIDIRGAGSLDATADAVLLLFRDEYYDPDSQLRGVCEVDVARNRNGVTTTLSLAFLRDFCRFENLAPRRPGGTA